MSESPNSGSESNSGLLVKKDERKCLGKRTMEAILASEYVTIRRVGPFDRMSLQYVKILYRRGNASV